VSQKDPVSIDLILQDNVQGVDNAGNVSENGQEDVDEEVSAAATLKENSERGDEDGEDELDDVASGERHDGRLKFGGVWRVFRWGVLGLLFAGEVYKSERASNEVGEVWCFIAKVKARFCLVPALSDSDVTQK